MVVPATDTFGSRNQGQTVDEAVAVGCEILRDAARAGFRATATIAVAFGCPFEGDVDTRRVLDIALRLADAGPVELALADTIGVGVPGQVLDCSAPCAQPLGACRCARTSTTRATPASRMHSPRCRSASKRSTRASAASAVARLRRKRPATSRTEDLIYMLDRMKVDTTANSTGDRDAHWLGGVLGKELPAMVSRAGGFPVATAMRRQ